jgi:hypothetical protein
MSFEKIRASCFEVKTDEVAVDASCVTAMSSSVCLSSNSEVESRSEAATRAATDKKCEPLEGLDLKDKGADQKDDKKASESIDTEDESIDIDIDNIEEVEGFLYIDHLNFDDEFDDKIDFELLQGETVVSSQLVLHESSQKVVQTVAPRVAPVELDSKSLGGKLILGPGFRDEPDPKLLAASLGELKERSESNN